eukprot:Amastigsp_a175570_104.p3 type:complete len:140 gc:universal Amastigsp_a175570_104:160-579(+)
MQRQRDHERPALERISRSDTVRGPEPVAHSADADLVDLAAELGDVLEFAAIALCVFVVIACGRARKRLEEPKQKHTRREVDDWVADDVRERVFGPHPLGEKRQACIHEHTRLFGAQRLRVRVKDYTCRSSRCGHTTEGR